MGVNFFERDGAMFVPNQSGFAANSMQPFDDVLRVGDAATQQQQLGLRRRKRDSEFALIQTQDRGSGVLLVVLIWVAITVINLSFHRSRR